MKKQYITHLKKFLIGAGIIVKTDINANYKENLK